MGKSHRSAGDDFRGNWLTRCHIHRTGRRQGRQKTRNGGADISSNSERENLLKPQHSRSGQRHDK